MINFSNFIKFGFLIKHIILNRMILRNFSQDMIQQVNFFLKNEYSRKNNILAFLQIYRQLIYQQKSIFKSLLHYNFIFDEYVIQYLSYRQLQFNQNNLSIHDLSSILERGQTSFFLLDWGVKLFQALHFNLPLQIIYNQLTFHNNASFKIQIELDQNLQLKLQPQTKMLRKIKKIQNIQNKLMYRKGKSDPLEILRDHIIQKKPIKLKSKGDDHRLIFEGNNTSIEFKFTQETAWRSTKNNKDYNLGTLWLFLDNKIKGVQNKDYIKNAMDMKIEFVSRTDQDEVFDYFTGKVDYTDCIHTEKKTNLNKKDDNEFQSNKKVKTDEKEVLSEKDFNLKVIDEIYRFEKPITTRNRLFRVQDKSFEGIMQIAKQVFQGQSVPSDQVEETQDIQQSILYKFVRTKESPIIIVPQIHEVGNICLKNALQFLQEGKYVDPTTVRFTQEERFLQMKKKIREYEVNFTILENVQKKDWDKVVAIFLRGSSYELKNFQEQDPQKLFKRQFIIQNKKYSRVSSQIRR
ncbi:hypothetical protein pb186bvf_001125 [Paramecium bursaria]